MCRSDRPSCEEFSKLHGVGWCLVHAHRGSSFIISAGPLLGSFSCWFPGAENAVQSHAAPGGHWGHVWGGPRLLHPSKFLLLPTWAPGEGREAR